MENMNQDFRRFCAIAKKNGAKESKVISARTIAVEPWVRWKCRFGCDGYQQTLMCPPFSPTFEETRKMIASYTKAILIHGDEHADMTRIAAAVEREIFLSGYYKAFGFGSGPCRLCRTCDVDGSCKHPYQARPSMESCGIDVFKTARKNGFKIEVVKNYDCQANYFGLVLIE